MMGARTRQRRRRRHLRQLPAAMPLQLRLVLFLLLEAKCARQLRLSILTVAPRLTELRQEKRVVDSGDRRRTHSGRAAILRRAA